MEKHTIEPFYNEFSKVLILGSFPSITSRNMGFFYAHPQNRFWQVLEIVFDTKIGKDIDSKKDFLNKYNIALYDVCFECEIKGSSDSSIKKVIPTDIGKLLKSSNIKKIYTNGKLSFNLYNKLIKDKVKIEAVSLPSTSPANAKYKLEDLVKEYKVIKEYLDKV